MPTTGTNAFSILYETHGLFFGMILYNVCDEMDLWPTRGPRGGQRAAGGNS